MLLNTVECCWNLISNIQQLVDNSGPTCWGKNQSLLLVSHMNHSWCGSSHMLTLTIGRRWRFPQPTLNSLVLSTPHKEPPAAHLLRVDDPNSGEVLNHWLVIPDQRAWKWLRWWIYQPNYHQTTAWNEVSFADHHFPWLVVSMAQNWWFCWQCQRRAIDGWWSNLKRLAEEWAKLVGSWGSQPDLTNKD